MGHGGFAEYAVADDTMITPIPDSMNCVEASAFPVVYPTSYSALRHGANLQPGETVIVHAGAGGVGLAAIQLAKAWGGAVIATAGGAEKCGICRAHGAELAIDYTSEPWLERVKEFTKGRGADVIYDPVGGDVTDQSVKCLAWRGRLLIIGFAQGRIPSISANRLLLMSASAIGVFWGERRRREPKLAEEVMDDLFAIYAQGLIKPVIFREYPLSDAPLALRDLAGRQTYGKVVLIP
jgi:NADPH2:quinone reductase